MHAARGMACGVGLALVALAATADAAPTVLLRLGNLTTAAESARIGFAFTLDGPPLVDELPAGALTTFLPGPPAGLALQELWVLPRGLFLPKSLPEPLPLALPGLENAGAAPQLAFFSVFLIDRPGHGSSGERVRQLIAGTAPPAAGTHLRVLNLAGAAALDVCALDDSVLTRAVPAWGLSGAPQWFSAEPQPALPQAAQAKESPRPVSYMDLRIATEPPCRGEALAALPRPERGTFTIVLLPPAAATALASPEAAAGAPPLRALVLDEASLAPEHLVPLPVRRGPAAKWAPKSAQSSVR